MVAPQRTQASTLSAHSSPTPRDGADSSTQSSPGALANREPAGTPRPLRLRDNPDVGQRRLPPVRVSLLRFLVGDGG